jgi:hypothetical protein
MKLLLLLLALQSPQPHVIYVHGKAVEEGGRRPSTEFGIYEYDAILDAFRRAGFSVTSEQRPRGADVAVYAHRVEREVRSLLRAGVKPSHITVIGASKGAVITMLASTYLQEPEVRYVILGDCNDWVMKNLDVRLSGRVLSIYEVSDEYGTTCKPFFDRAGKLTESKEIALHLGIKHAFLYSPRPEWLKPAVDWIKRSPASPAAAATTPR